MECSLVGVLKLLGQLTSAQRTSFTSAYSSGLARPSDAAPPGPGRPGLLSPKAQGVCYAYAIASAVRAVQCRIPGRRPDEQRDLVEGVVRHFGQKGADARRVLEWLLGPSPFHGSMRGIQYRDLGRDCAQAQGALDSDRAVIWCFWLTDGQWAAVCDWVKERPQDTFTRDDLPRREAAHMTGHAMVLMGYTGQCWLLKRGRAPGGDFLKFRADVFEIASYVEVFWHDSGPPTRPVPEPPTRPVPEPPTRPVPERGLPRARAATPPPAVAAHPPHNVTALNPLSLPNPGRRDPPNSARCTPADGRAGQTVMAF